MKSTPFLLFLLPAIALAHPTGSVWQGTTAPPSGTLLVLPKGPRADATVRCYAISCEQEQLVVTSLSVAESGTISFSAAVDSLSDPSGAAIWNDRLVVTQTKTASLLFFSLTGKKLLSTQSLPDFPSPRGAAYDASGKLWVLSGNSLAELSFTPDGHFNPIHHRGDFSDPRSLVIFADGRFCISENGPPAAVKFLDGQLALLEIKPMPSCPQLSPDATGRVWSWFQQQPTHGVMLSDSAQSPPTPR